MKKKTPLKTELKPEVVTFTDEEVRKVANFVNLVYKNASFNFTSKGAQEYVALLSHMHRHVEMCNAHVMEHIKTTKAAK